MTSLPLLLASASPRRRQIITRLGLPVTCVVAPFDEEAATARYTGPAEELGRWLAEHKARAALTLPEAVNHLIVASDTTVLRAGADLGKPRDAAHARDLLLALRGRWHHVVTGVAVARLLDDSTILRSASCTTPVLMRPYSEQEIVAYIATGDPLDKAGAYGIQHPTFQLTERIDGCYLNVVGLPLCLLTTLLAEFGVSPILPTQQTGSCPWSERCL